METFRFYQIDLFAMLLLGVILFVIRINQKKYSYRLFIFRMFIYTCLTILGFEILVWLFDGQPGDVNRILVYLTNSVLIVFSVLMPAILAYYVEFTVYQDRQKLKKKEPYYFLPSTIMFVLVIINAFYPILFSVDENNKYADLPLLWIAVGIALVIYIYLVYFVIKHRNKLQAKYLFGVIVFISIPIIGSMLQMIYYGLLVTWSLTALAITYMYLVFETTTSSMDYLTGISTRKYAEEYIEHLINSGQTFDVYMIDMDNFKELNDTYGHREGDRILIHVANNLKKIFSTKSVVSRYGGDEFLVVTVDLSRGQEEIKKTFEQYRLSLSSEHLKEVRCSIGYFRSESKNTTINQVIMNADESMYIDKNNNKSK